MNDTKKLVLLQFRNLGKCQGKGEPDFQGEDWPAAGGISEGV